MKAVIAMDSFKGSMTSMEAGESAARGIKKVYPNADICVRPLADGGEGTVDALTTGCGGKLVNIDVTGAHGRRVSCAYGMAEASGKAIIEMSGAAGITMVRGEERNPLYTTTYGVGEVIRDAIARGCRHFLIGIGGSATNDGGIGMLQALGFGILNEKGEQVRRGGIGLSEVRRIAKDQVLPELSECTFRVACDVTNPLCGEHGASAVYGPQKGADEEMIQKLDQWLSEFALLAKKTYPDADADYPGAGAAGGLGFALRTFFNAQLESGIHIVLEETKLEDYVKDADIVVTGEGKLDAQTVMGKAPAGVAEIAKKYKKPVIAFSGCVTKDAAACNEKGIDAFFPIVQSSVTLEEAMNTENAMRNMTHTVEQAFRLIKIFR